MKKNKIFCFKDNLYVSKFYQEVHKIKQDTVFHHTSYKSKKREYCIKKIIYQQDINIYFFNNDYSYNFITSNPVSYVKNELFYPELQKLMRKEYDSEVCVDLHGLNQHQAQVELSKLIIICHILKLYCCSIIHGHGKNILKSQIPIWLSKHPDIIAFYQVPKLFGHNTTLYVLIKRTLHDK